MSNELLNRLKSDTMCYYIDSSLLLEFTTEILSITKEELLKNIDLVIPFNKTLYAFINHEKNVFHIRYTKTNNANGYRFEVISDEMEAYIKIAKENSRQADEQILDLFPNYEKFCQEIANHYLLKLFVLFKKRKTYLVTAKRSFKTTTGKKQKTEKRRITYITINKTKNAIKFTTPQTFRQSPDHEFDVAGHWRSIKGLGKNQKGEYSEVGRTWVKEFKKGNGEYIRKTRIITMGTNQHE